MRFTDAYLRQLRDRVSIVAYAGKKLTWDQRKSRPPAGDYWACCPFHTEKTSSFHVLDAKGIYNCFGCGEKGDVIGLAMKLEGVNFPEAIKTLADMAGMELPPDDFEDRGQADQRKKLLSVMAEAAKFYANALRGPDGRDARDYLKRRGLTEDVWERFGIGYAPGGWQATIDGLGVRGFKLDDLITCGLARPGQDGKRAIDTFRERVTFEIADASGKVIAFGARSLDPNNDAKYINSPETPLFHKGSTLYRLKHARELLAKTKAEGLVVAEGYLDVIAFERAGIAAVAPLGTALTEDQLNLAWRSGASPVLCFDGDAAGQRAADKALVLALPHIGPAKTVRIALLSNKEDPDDLYRRAGAEGLAELIANAKQAADALFAREAARTTLATPEQKAAFKDRLRQAAMRIEDAETKRLYLSELLSRADALVRPPRLPFTLAKPRAAQPNTRNRNGKWMPPPPMPTEELKQQAQAQRLSAEDFLREAVDRPSLLARVGDWIDRLPLSDPELLAIRGAIQALTRADLADLAVDREAVTRHLVELGEERAAARILRWPRPRSSEGTNRDVEAQWLARMTHDVIVPSIGEEMAALKVLADAGDDAAFLKFQALGREARDLKAQALEERSDPEAA